MANNWVDPNRVPSSIISSLKREREGKFRKARVAAALCILCLLGAIGVVSWGSVPHSHVMAPTTVARVVSHTINIQIRDRHTTAVNEEIGLEVLRAESMRGFVRSFPRRFMSADKSAVSPSYFEPKLWRAVGGNAAQQFDTSFNYSASDVMLRLGSPEEAFLPKGVANYTLQYLVGGIIEQSKDEYDLFSYFPAIRNPFEVQNMQVTLTLPRLFKIQELFDAGELTIYEAEVNQKSGESRKVAKRKIAGVPATVVSTSYAANGEKIQFEQPIMKFELGAVSADVGLGVSMKLPKLGKAWAALEQAPIRIERK